MDNKEEVIPGSPTTHLSASVHQNQVAAHIMAEVVTYRKYRKYDPKLKRKETWPECVARNFEMHCEFYKDRIAEHPELRKELYNAYELVLERKVLPSMRSLQFGGEPILEKNNRIFNCAFTTIQRLKDFVDLMYLLMGGTGLGFSVQKQHVAKLPNLVPPNRDLPVRTFIVEDSTEGWCDGFYALFDTYMPEDGVPRAPIKMDLDRIRPKGALIRKIQEFAPGRGPIERAYNRVDDLFNDLIGQGVTHIRPIHAHDIVCMMSECVKAGGIRRAALISLFSPDDQEMLECKSVPDLHTAQSQRYMANNSAVINRKDPKAKEYFDNLFHVLQESKRGEPGIYWTNDEDWGTNPCVEASLRDGQFCNLTEANVSEVETQEEFEEYVRAAALLGTFQAGYTNFKYLHPRWKEQTEMDALLGVSMTGIANGKVLKLDLKAAAHAVVDENRKIAKLLGINPAARTTLVKPAGTTSLVMECASGIHPWHHPYYLRRITIGKNEPIYEYLSGTLPGLVEDSIYDAEEAYLVCPQRVTSASAKFRDEGVVSFLERVLRVSTDYVHEGHVDGVNTHNVSATLSIKDDEWEIARTWLWEHRHSYNGMACFPYSDPDFDQLMIEDTTEERFNELYSLMRELDLTQIDETTSRQVAFELLVACAGNECENPRFRDVDASKE